jgi:hypothetical protein
MFIRRPHRILSFETEHERLIATVELWSCHTAKWIQNPYNVHQKPHRIPPCETEHERLIATIELWSCHAAKLIQNPYECSSEARTASHPVKQNTND